MSLTFFKNNKPDNRMVEYDQAVVRLGLEKAKVQAELDRLRAEIAEIGTIKANFINGIADAEKKLLIIRREITDTINKGKKDIAEVSREWQKAEETIGKKKKNMIQSEKDFVDFREKTKIQRETLVSIKEQTNEAKKILDGVQGEFNAILTKKSSVEKDILILQELKAEVKKSVAAGEKVLEELAKKEQFLNRKEADLIKYEKRVEKAREDTGNKNKMKFK